MKKIYPQNIETGEKKFKLIACEIMFREACYILSQTRSIADVVFMPNRNA